MGPMVGVLAQMMDRGDMDGGGGHWWAWLIGLAVLAVVIGLVVGAVIRTTTHPQQASSGSPPGRMSAEDVLADRLARGEIDTDEYRQRLGALRGG